MLGPHCGTGLSRTGKRVGQNPNQLIKYGDYHMLNVAVSSIATAFSCIKFMKPSLFFFQESLDCSEEKSPSQQTAENI